MALTTDHSRRRNGERAHDEGDEEGKKHEVHDLSRYSLRENGEEEMEQPRVLI